jgi:hypothetical protein
MALPRSRAEELKGGIKLTMPARDLSDETLRFIVHLGVEWITMGGPGAPNYNEEDGWSVRRAIIPKRRGNWISYSGSRRDQINHVHFRNVLRKVPREKYTETFIDAGDNDMLACLRALHSTGYPRLLHPDPVPESTGDPLQRGGWGYAVGQIKALLRQL